MALVPVGIYLYVAVRRIGYPFELEWMEGGAVEVVKRVLDGHAIYTQPSLHYVPYVYPPVYFWVSAAVAHLTGIGFLPLRLVSFIASCGTFVALFIIVRRETADRVAGVVAAGLYAATFSASDAWFDIGRVDSLFVFLIILSVGAARSARNTKAGVVSGLLFLAAALTKQTAVLAVTPLLVILLVTRLRVGLAALVTLASGIAGTTIWLDSQSHGWYGYYVLKELAHHSVVGASWGSFVPKDLLEPFGMAVLLALTGLVWSVARRAVRVPVAFWCSVVVGFVGAAWISRLHQGGGQDVLMPAYAGLALAGGLGFGLVSPANLRDEPPRVVAGRPQGLPASPGRPRAQTVGLLGLACLGAVVASQFALLAYSPSRQIPSSADEAQGRRFVAMVSRVRGKVIVLDHPWYGNMAGKPSWAQGEAVVDVLRAGPNKAASDLRASIRRTLASPGVSAVFVDNPGDAATLTSTLDTWYRPTRDPFSCYQCFFPVTDLPLRPYMPYVRR